MKLELKHLAPYLPYGLKLQYIVRDVVERYGTMVSITHDKGSTHPTKIALDYYDSEHIWMFKPILRPLSDFDKLNNDFDLTTDFETVYQITNGDICFVNTSDKSYLSDFLIVNKFMFEHHFDVFGLIDNGLAIDINQTNPSPGH